MIEQNEDFNEEENLKSLANRLTNPNIFRSLQAICSIWECYLKSELLVYVKTISKKILELTIFYSRSIKIH